VRPPRRLSSRAVSGNTNYPLNQCQALAFLTPDNGKNAEKASAVVYAPWATGPIRSYGCQVALPQEFIRMDSQRSSVILRAFLADAKNQEQFGKFAAKYQPRIKRCCRVCGLKDDADADDLTAAILLRFCERDVFDGFVFQTKEKFNAWLNKVVRNDVLTFLRNRNRNPEAWSVGNADAQQSLQQVSEEMVRDLRAVCDEDRARVDTAFAHVKQRVEAKTWTAFYLVVVEEMSVKDTAKHLGATPVGVWQAISRVKRKLREELKDLHDPASTEQ